MMTMMATSLRASARLAVLKPRYLSSLNSLFNPTEEHTALRSTLRTFVEKEVRIICDVTSECQERRTRELTSFFTTFYR